ncbi:cytochrome c3 family protein [Spirosoma sp. 209]|uniref:cytochrome c3 family protein n=1 Tax=Spirosoma sp. 209 TaxID=1955701 RepID=UPI00098D31A2|nr:cytochrome c3 family protein [Spirosoma sp. 209]
MVQLKRQTGLLLLAGLVFAVAVFYALWLPADKSIAVNWQSQVSPGHLSVAHAQFATNCAACHTPVMGIDEAKCISCHADNKELLGRQPTAFHATIGNCASCHVEHLGVDANLRVMDHKALARIGNKLFASARKTPNSSGKAMLPAGHPLLSALEADLNCAGCHSTKDPHFGLFGPDCASCHAATEWTISAFQHPSPRSTECVSCHQAPPSHYMMHFEMVDKTVVAGGSSGQVEGCCGGVDVTQCYKCHQTTAWNDIKGVGFYKHH